MVVVTVVLLVTTRVPSLARFSGVPINELSSNPAITPITNVAARCGSPNLNKEVNDHILFILNKTIGKRIWRVP